MIEETAPHQSRQDKGLPCPGHPGRVYTCRSGGIQSLRQPPCALVAAVNGKEAFQILHVTKLLTLEQWLPDNTINSDLLIETFIFATAVRKRDATYERHTGGYRNEGCNAMSAVLILNFND